MRFRLTDQYAEVDPERVYQQHAKDTIYIRSESRCFVYWWRDGETEVLAGYGDTPFEIEMLPGSFRVACEQRAFIKSGSVQQASFKATDEVFTSLDRPSPLSPEMLAIQRMSRANEIERERLRTRIERAEQANAELREQQLRGSDSLVLEQHPEPEEHRDSEDDTGSGEEPETPENEGTETAAKKPARRNTKDSGRRDSQRKEPAKTRGKAAQAAGK